MVPNNAKDAVASNDVHIGDSPESLEDGFELLAKTLWLLLAESRAACKAAVQVIPRPGQQPN